MKEFFKGTVGVVIGVLLIVGLVFGGGYMGLKYKATFGKANQNIDREIFKEGNTYNEGVLDDLAKYRYDMTFAEDDAEKAAIADLVNSRFANFNEDKIESDDLKEFLSDCRDGEYKVEKGE